MASNVSLITNEIQMKAANLQPGNEKQRRSLLQSARALVTHLETPQERIMRMCYHDSVLFTSVKILNDLDIFKILAQCKETKTAAALAKESGADQILLERLLKHIATENFVHENGADTYTANDFTRALASVGCQGVISEMFPLLRILENLPDFLKENKYANPTDKDKTAWKYGWNTDQHYFEYINSPGKEWKLEAFRNHMAFKNQGVKWFEIPEIMKGVFGNVPIEKDDVLLIDVGGNGGHDLMDFHKAHPSMTGRLILQDLPTVIESLDSTALRHQSVEPVGHDFFTPQPIQGAKVYHFKYILHDWPSSQCVQILTQLKAALRPGHSKILLNEIVVPEVNANWYETSVDLLMMYVHSSQERREREWKELVTKVDGLKITRIWDVPGAVEKVIEIELV